MELDEQGNPIIPEDLRGEGVNPADTVKVPDDVNE